MFRDRPGCDLRWEAGFLAPDGQAVGKALRFGNDRRGLQALLERMRQVPQPVPSGLEATGHYWLALHTALAREGLPVQVLNPLRIRSAPLLCREQRRRRTAP